MKKKIEKIKSGAIILVARITRFLNNHISFRKIFGEMVEGGISNEIVGWYKGRWYTDGKNVVQYKYRVHIDLWIVKLGITWLYPFKLDHLNQQDNQKGEE